MDAVCRSGKQDRHKKRDDSHSWPGVLHACGIVCAVPSIGGRIQTWTLEQHGQVLLTRHNYHPHAQTNEVSSQKQIRCSKQKLRDVGICIRKHCGLEQCVTWFEESVGVRNASVFHRRKRHYAPHKKTTRDTTNIHHIESPLVSDTWCTYHTKVQTTHVGTSSTSGDMTTARRAG